MKIHPQIKQELEVLKKILEKSRTDVNIEYKLKTYEILRELQAEAARSFGMFIILGWQEKWHRRYCAEADAAQDLFKENKSHIFEGKDEIAKTLYFDDAILIRRDGMIVASGVFIEDLSPKHVAMMVGPLRNGDLSTRLGFMRKVHARHLSAIAASYQLRGTTVYTVSEHSGAVRLYELGRIVFSTVAEEISREENPWLLDLPNKFFVSLKKLIVRK